MELHQRRLNSSELYNPASASFTPTVGSLKTARFEHTATLLSNGMVLIVGGWTGSMALASAELYNPATGTFTPTAGSLSTARFFHTATLLSNGTVLIAGGATSCGFSGCTLTATAEIYNPATETFTGTGTLKAARYYHSATPLNDGTVLIAGGIRNSNNLPSAELYNPATGTFTATAGGLNSPRSFHTATLLNNGMVLIAGGTSSGYLSSAELYNPATGTFALTAGVLNTARAYHTATLLNNGTVLIAGGSNGNVVSKTELFSPIVDTFTVTETLNTGRYTHTGTLLNDGTVLVAGGSNDPFHSTALSSAELYHPASLTPSGLLSISISPTNPRLAIGNAMSFTATGTFSGNGPEALQSVTWSSSNTAVATITNDSGGSATNDSTNRGNAYGVASGTTTITACAGSICGSTVLTVHMFTDGSNFASGNSTTVSTSVTPTLSNDFAVVVLGSQSSIGQTLPILPAGYTSISADGNTTIAYRQLTTTARESPTKTINSAEWAEGLVLLVTKTGNSAAFRSTSIIQSGGAITGPTKTLTPANPYLAGSTVLVCVKAYDINTSGGAPTITSITDTQSNTYVKLGAVAVGGGPGGADGAAVEIWGAANVVGGTPTITVNIAGGGGWGGVLGAYEFTGVI